MTTLSFKRDSKTVDALYFLLRTISHIGLFLTNEILKKDRKQLYLKDIKLLINLGNLSYESKAKKDTISWIPYTFWALNQEASDPVNIVCYNTTSEKLAEMLVRRDPAWKKVRGSYQFIFAQKNGAYLRFN